MNIDGILDNSILPFPVFVNLINILWIGKETSLFSEDSHRKVLAIDVCNLLSHNINNMLCACIRGVALSFYLPTHIQRGKASVAKC